MTLKPGTRLRRRELMTRIMKEVLPEGGIVVSWNERAQSARLLGGDLVYAEDIRKFYDIIDRFSAIGGGAEGGPGESEGGRGASA